MRPAHEGGHARRPDWWRQRNAGVPTKEAATGGTGYIDLGGNHQDDGHSRSDSHEPPDREEPATQPAMHPGKLHPRMDSLLAEQVFLQELVLKLSLPHRGSVRVVRVRGVCHRYGLPG